MNGDDGPDLALAYGVLQERSDVQVPAVPAWAAKKSGKLYALLVNDVQDFNSNYDGDISCNMMTRTPAVSLRG